MGVIPLSRTAFSAREALGAINDARRLGRPEIFARLDRACRSALGWDGSMVFGNSARHLLQRAVSASLPATGGGRVVFPAFGCAAVREAIERAGAVPVPCDIDRDSGGVALADLQRCLSYGACAIVLVPLFGVAGTLAAAAQMARVRGAAVIVDAAAAFSPALPRLMALQASTFIFSFAAGKHVPLFGGGMALARETAIVDRLQMPEAPPASAAEEASTAAAILTYALTWRAHVPAGMAALAARRARAEGPGARRFTTIGAALGTRLLPRIAHDLQRRQTNEGHYRRGFAALSATTGAVSLACGAEASLPLLRFPILVRDSETRARLLQRLWKAGIWASETGYRPPTDPLRFAGAEAFAGRLVTLPVHAGMTEPDIDRIMAVLTAELGPTPPRTGKMPG